MSMNSLGNETRAFITTRVFNASRERLWQAFADHVQLAKWWGPAGFTNTIHEFSFEPGVLWKYTMHAPDGTDYYNESELLEIVPGERIVVLHLRPMHRFEMTMTYDQVSAEQTRLTWVMVFDDEAEADRVRAFVPAANEQNFDRLEELVAKSK